MKQLLGYSTLMAGILISSVSYAGNFDKTMKKILKEYTSIQEALAADQWSSKVTSSAKKIRTLSESLAKTKIPKEHQKHYKKIPMDLKMTAAELSQSKDLKTGREAFKKMSRSVAMWFSMTPQKDHALLYCSMAKASWVQKSGMTKNPYYGKSMISCGEKVEPQSTSKQQHKSNYDHGHHS